MTASYFSYAVSLVGNHMSRLISQSISMLTVVGYSYVFDVRCVSYYGDCIKVRKRAKIRNRYNQAPHLTQDTNGKVTTSQLDITNASQEVSKAKVNCIGMFHEQGQRSHYQCKLTWFVM